MLRKLDLYQGKREYRPKSKNLIFKSKLDTFRLSEYQTNKLGHYQELSYDIFDRIDVSVM